MVRSIGAKATQANGQPRRMAQPASRGTMEKYLASKMVREVQSSSSVAAVVVGSSEIWWLNRPGEVIKNATARYAQVIFFILRHSRRNTAAANASTAADIPPRINRHKNQKLDGDAIHGTAVPDLMLQKHREGRVLLRCTDYLEDRSVHCSIEPGAQGKLRRLFPGLLPAPQQQVVNRLPEVESLVAVADGGSIGGQEAGDKDEEEQGEERVQNGRIGSAGAWAAGGRCRRGRGGGLRGAGFALAHDHV